MFSLVGSLDMAIDIAAPRRAENEFQQSRYVWVGGSLVESLRPREYTRRHANTSTASGFIREMQGLDAPGGWSATRLCPRRESPRPPRRGRTRNRPRASAGRPAS